MDFFNIILHRGEEDEEQYLKYRAQNDHLLIEVEVFQHSQGFIVDFAKIEGDKVEFKEIVNVIKQAS